VLRRAPASSTDSLGPATLARFFCIEPGTFGRAARLSHVISIQGDAGSEPYQPRDTSSEVLHRVLLAHLETFLARVASDDCTPSLPHHVERELRGHLSCGVLAHGFCRFFCFACGTDILVPFSCKGRGFCPSCGGRRMAESAAHLVDHVFPGVPIRQWVISFPWRLRYLLALDSQLCRAVRRVFLRAVFALYAKKAQLDGHARGRTGAVNQIQRYGSALNSNVHFHALVLDGVYTSTSALAVPTFHPATRFTDAEVMQLLKAIRSRALRLCRSRGFLGEEGEASVSEFAEHQGLLPLFCAASIQGRAALATEPGSPIERLGVPVASLPGRAVVVKELCANLEGWSLHAGVRVKAGDTSRLEHLCRYVTRPALSNKRLSLSPAGEVVYELRAPFRDGTTHFIFEPLAFIERLAALVPPPRMHQLTYHGVLAPAASWRSDIVPGPTEREPPSADGAGRPCSKYSWSELLARVFRVDALKCSRCGSRRQWIAALTNREAIVRILDHLDLPSIAPIPAPPRAPPQMELEFEGC